MTATPHLGLPLLAAAQSQKHVTHNEALALLDGLVQLSVLESDRGSPPEAPGEGDRYLVAGPATGAFAGKEGQIALYNAGVWRFFAPQAGWRAFVAEGARLRVYDGSAWLDAGRFLRELDAVERIGIGSSPDAANPLAAKLNAALFTARGAGEGGTGDLRFVLNKEAPGGVLSQLYQTGYSGRAETGLAGDDDFRIRVSADGVQWRDAMRVDRTTGTVSFPSGAAGLRDTPNLLINPECRVNQRLFAGGALGTGAYGFDRWKAGTGGCTLGRAADGTLTLTGPLIQVIEAPGLGGEVVTVSVENPTAAVGVQVAGVAGTISAGSGRRSVTLEVPAGVTGDVIVVLTGTAASFSKPMLNWGPSPARFERLPAAVELDRCRRYFAKTFPEAVAPGGGAGYAGSLVSHAILANSIPAVRWQLPMTMRAVPALTFYNPAAANGQWSAGGVAAAVSTAVPASAEVVCIAVAAGATPTLAAGALTAVHAVADAEL